MSGAGRLGASARKFGALGLLTLATLIVVGISWTYIRARMSQPVALDVLLQMEDEVAVLPAACRAYRQMQEGGVTQGEHFDTYLPALRQAFWEETQTLWQEMQAAADGAGGRWPLATEDGLEAAPHFAPSLHERLVRRLWPQPADDDRRIRAARLLTDKFWREPTTLSSRSPLSTPFLLAMVQAADEPGLRPEIERILAARHLFSSDLDAIAEKAEQLRREALVARIDAAAATCSTCEQPRREVPR